MSEILPIKDPDNESPKDSLIQSERSQLVASKEEQIYKKFSFRISFISSFLIHIVIFLWVFIFSTETEYRFYGSGTAVSLIGADEIPGGSAKGKSGDIIPVKQKKIEIEKPLVKKTVFKRNRKPPTKRVVKNKEKVRTISPVKKKKVKKIEVKSLKKIKTKKKIQALSEKRKRIKKKKRKRIRKKKKRIRKKKKRRRIKKKVNSGQKRYQAYRKKYLKRIRNEKKNTKKSKTFKLAQSEKIGKTSDGKSSPIRPKVGYLGEGGGDGQGGGSKQPRTGGIGNLNSALERYYGVLTSRISSFTEFPPIPGISSLRVTFDVDIYRNGRYRKLRIKKSSGNKTYDLSAKNAILRAFDPLVPKFPETIKDKMIPTGFRFCGTGFCKD